MKQIPYGKRNIEYYIKRAFIEDGISDISLIEDYIVEYFRKKYISPNDKKLLELYFKKEVSQEDLDNFLESWDIEKEGAHKALLLSSFMKKHPELNYPKYVKPRLDGMLKYYRFKNLNGISHFKKACSALRKENIDVLIMKGGGNDALPTGFPQNNRRYRYSCSF